MIDAIACHTQSGPLSIVFTIDCLRFVKRVQLMLTLFIFLLCFCSSAYQWVMNVCFLWYVNNCKYSLKRMIFIFFPVLLAIIDIFLLDITWSKQLWKMTILIFYNSGYQINKNGFGYTLIIVSIIFE